MMIKEFIDKLRSDQDFQRKLETAARAYTGEMNDEEIFKSVIQPLGANNGLDFTFEEFKAYAEEIKKDQINELDLDEMMAVTGGDIGAGAGYVRCDSLGGGFGGGFGDGAGAFCFIVGFGGGEVGCLTVGFAQTEEEIQKGIEEKKQNKT